MPGSICTRRLNDKLIVRICRELQIGRHVLDVRLLEEANAARDAERNVAPREFQLQFERVKVRAIEHRHLVQVAAFLAQFQHALRDEGRLLVGVAAGHEHRLAAGLFRRGEFLGELVDVRRDRGVRDGKNLRRAAVIDLDLVNLRAGIALGKFEDVAEVRAAPRVDALRIVAHHHHVLVLRAEQIDEVALELVRVLVFVHENELEAALVTLAHVLVLLQELEPEREQIVEVHHVRGLLALAIAVRPRLRSAARAARSNRIPARRLPATLRCVFTDIEMMSLTTSAFGKRVAFTSISASAMQVLSRSLESSRSRIVKSFR